MMNYFRSVQVAHLTELLRESEASNARLAEESKMLKEGGKPITIKSTRCFIL